VAIETSSAGGPGTKAPSPRTHPSSGGLLNTIGRNLPLPLPVPDWSKPIIAALILLAITLGLRSRLMGLRARRLEDQRGALLLDVDAMQSALVPEIPARLGSLAISVAYRPADGPAAGGDFYDLFDIEDGKVAIILGDVSGHGREAVKRAALTRYTLRAYLQAGLEPRAVLALAGEVLANQEEEHFATVLVGVHDPRDGRLTYASAGHPPPIVDGYEERAPLEVCCSPPIGWDVPTGRRQTTVSISAGVVACFFTDGLIEARCEGGLFERERLSELLGGLSPDPRAEDLLEGVRAAALSTPDDMAACILRPVQTVAVERVHLEELEADAKTLQGAGVRSFLGICGVPAGEIEQTLARALEIAAAEGTALLRVERGRAPATVSVSAPGASQAAIVDRSRKAQGMEPIRGALPVGSDIPI
jgi:Stage II sporulation protein E (SpoIIE)